MVRPNLLYALLWIAQLSYLGMEDVDNILDIAHTIDKDDCFLDVFYLFGLWRKYKLKIQATRPGMLHKSIDLHNLWTIKRGLRQVIIG